MVDDIFFKYSFNLWQMCGFHVTQNCFYEPIPDTKKLAPDTFKKISSLSGVDVHENKQLEILNKFRNEFKKEFDLIPFDTRNKNEYFINNDSFASVDGEILYCMIRFLKPKRIYEIGSGNSTLLIVQATEKNKEETGLECEIISIDPYHDDMIKNIAPGKIKLLVKKVENLDLSIFDCLEENDILFIDSSHVLKIGSDVQYEYLDLLPRLNKGVFVHVHDIFLPAEYPKDWVLKEHRFWNEQYLLQAFLSFNDSFEIVLANSYLHLKHSEKLKETFNSYDRNKNWPASFWIKKIK